VFRSVLIFFLEPSLRKANPMCQGESDRTQPGSSGGGWWPLPGHLPFPFGSLRLVRGPLWGGRVGGGREALKRELTPEEEDNLGLFASNACLGS
jgi:hypothetical protein